MFTVYIEKNIFFSNLESLKKSYTKLNGREWKRFIDFMPLLSISESKINGIQHVREIRNRVYLFSEYFSVSIQNTSTKRFLVVSIS